MPPIPKFRFCAQNGHANLCATLEYRYRYPQYVQNRTANVDLFDYSVSEGLDPERPAANQGSANINNIGKPPYTRQSNGEYEQITSSFQSGHSRRIPSPFNMSETTRGQLSKLLRPNTRSLVLAQTRASQQAYENKTVPAIEQISPATTPHLMGSHCLDSPLTLTDDETRRDLARPKCRV